MSLGKLNYVLSNVNAVLGSGVSYIKDKQDGDKSGAAEVNFGLNVVNGLARNAVAEGIRRDTGSYLGYAVNGLAGYGDATSNAQGMVGLMGASLLTNPYMGGGCYGPSLFSGYFAPMPMYTPMPMYGGGCFGGGFYGGGMMYGGGTFFDVNRPFGMFGGGFNCCC